MKILYMRYPTIISYLLFAISAFIWMILMPLGVGPDDNHHITQTYCAYGERDQLCFDNETTPGTGVWSKATAPKKITQLGMCFRQTYSQSAQCSELGQAPDHSHFLLDPSLFFPKKYEFQKIWAGEHLGEKYMNKMFYSLYLKCEESCQYLFSAMDNQSKFYLFEIEPFEIDFDSTVVMSILPSVNGGSLQFYYNDRLINTYNLFDYGGDYSQQWNSLLGQDLSNNEFVSKLDPSNFEYGSVLPAYTYQINTFYLLSGWLATTDVTRSAWNMRLFDYITIMIFLATSGLLITKKTFKITLAVLAFTGVPMGFFLFGTNNPSLFAWVFAVIFTSLIYEVLMKGYDKNRFFSLFFVILVFVVGSVRNDVIIFNLLSLLFLFIIKFKMIHKSSYALILFFTLLINYYFSQKTVSLELHANLDWLSVIQFIPLHILTEFLSVIGGNFGDRGPLNLWGLSWYDVPIPSLVPIVIFSLLIFIWMISINNVSIYQSIVLTIAMGSVFGVQIISLLTTSANPPGGFIQSRYILPYFSSIFLLTVLVSNENNVLDNFRMTLRLKYLFGFLIFISAFISILVTVTRFGNGLAVVQEPWLSGNFTWNRSFSWVGGTRIMYQVPHINTLYSPLISSGHLVLLLCVIQAASNAFLSLPIVKRKSGS
jgi:hypothetical protein